MIFNCIILVCDPHSSVSCLYLLNLGTLLIFVNYVGCCQAAGTYCICYCDCSFSVLCVFVNLCILNACFSCLCFNYFNVSFALFSCILRSITCIQLLYKEMPTFLTFYFFKPCQLPTVVPALVVCCITLFYSLMMVLCGLRYVGLLSMIL
jgi:hypothetical protein